MTAEQLKTPVNWTDSGPLYLAGERIDGRYNFAKRYRELGADLAAQMGNFIAPSERMMLQRGATLALLCERDEAKLLSGELIEEENYRRNVVALRGIMISLGLAKKSRDVTKRESRMFDSHADAVLGLTDADE